MFANADAALILIQTLNMPQERNGDRNSSFHLTRCDFGNPNWTRLKCSAFLHDVIYRSAIGCHLHAVPLRKLASFSFSTCSGGSTSTDIWIWINGDGIFGCASIKCSMHSMFHVTLNTPSAGEDFSFFFGFRLPLRPCIRSEWIYHTRSVVNSMIFLAFRLSCRHFVYSACRICIYFSIIAQKISWLAADWFTRGIDIDTIFIFCKRNAPSTISLFVSRQP